MDEWLVAFQAATKAEAPAPDNGHSHLADSVPAVDEAEFLSQAGVGGLAGPEKMSGAWGLQHGDLKPEHVLWCDRSIGVVDWGEMKPGSVTGDWFFFLTHTTLQMGGVESPQQLAQTVPTLERVFFARHWFGELAVQATRRFLEHLGVPRSMAGPLFALSVCRDSRYRWPYLAHEPFGAYNDVLRLLRRRWGGPHLQQSGSLEKDSARTYHGLRPRPEASAGG